MENNELKEMRAQLATLNEKLEGESIVDEKHFNEATKKHLSKLQRKLISRIVMFTMLSAFFYWKLELGIFLFLSLGLLITSIYLYWVVRNGNSVSTPLTEYVQQIRKAQKIYRIANMIMWILTILLILAWGTYVFVLNWPSNIAEAFDVFFVCFLIAFIIGISYYINNVCATSYVDLNIEDVLIDLDKDYQEAE